MFVHLLAAAWAADPHGPKGRGPIPDLLVRAVDLPSDEGTVLCTLYDRAETWLEDPGWLATAKAKPEDGVATCVFPAVPPGTYAVTFLHDVNDNGDMDSNLLGLPKEPWGMTRDPSILLGPPPFEKAAFVHPAAEPVVAHAR